jgi:hypothetical protein
MTHYWCDDKVIGVMTHYWCDDKVIGVMTHYWCHEAVGTIVVLCHIIGAIILVNH